VEACRLVDQPIERIDEVFRVFFGVTQAIEGDGLAGEIDVPQLWQELRATPLLTIGVESGQSSLT